MMDCKRLFIFVAVACVVTASFVAVAEEPAAQPSIGDEVVETLTSSNFDSFVSENEVTLVEFYAPWCGHCKRLAPEYEKAAKLLKDSSGIRIAKVDATKDEDLARKFEVTGYPTLKFFRNGKPEEYKGGRTSESIVLWVESMTGPAVQVVSNRTEADAIAAKVEVVFIGSFNVENNDEFKIFHSVADAFRQIGKFVAYVDTKSSNVVVVRRKGEEGDVMHNITNKEAMEKFCKEERFPYFGPIDGENYGDYFESGRELIWFAAEQEDYDQNFNVIRDVAKQFRAENNFVWLNTEKFPDHAQGALGVKEFPSLVLQKKDGRYVFPYNSFDEKKVVKFLNDVAAGKVEKFLMSDDIPAPSDAAVKVVVGKTFKETVLQSEKDVLLEVYAPWCGHCKKFEPIYREFAEKMAQNKSLVVAMMDGTTNEAPVPNFEWKGFPTIFLVKAGENKPILFDGDRTMDALTEFVSKHMTKSLAEEERVKTEL